MVAAVGASLTADIIINDGDKCDAESGKDGSAEYGNPWNDFEHPMPGFGSSDNKVRALLASVSLIEILKKAHNSKPNLCTRYADKYHKAVENMLSLAHHCNGKRFRRLLKWKHAAHKYRIKAIKTQGMLIP